MTRCWLLIVFLAASVSAADSPDAKFLAGLRERRLFDLAETYCQDRLRTVPQGGTAESDLTLELIRTLALHASGAPPQARAPLWSKARQTAAAYLRRTPPPPRGLLVRMQDALTPLAEGELARLEFEAGLLTADQLEPGRRALREATALLEALDKELSREIPLRRRTPPRPGELSADELFGLGHDVQHELARAQRNRALLAERGSDDRRALLLAALETLQRPLAQLAEDEPLRPTLQLESAECQRLLGQLSPAAELAAALDREAQPAAVRLRARAELLRIAVAQKDWIAAQRLLAERTIGGATSAELDFAAFEAALALSASGGQYQQQAADLAKSLEEDYGPYWGRRADQLLLTALPRGGGNVQLLSRKADGLFLKRDFAQAIANYDDAAAAARAAGGLKGAFDLGYKAALVEQERGRHLEAATRLRILAKGFASHAQAPAAHLLACWHAAQLAKNDSQPADLYIELLREHLEQWPAADSAAQARLWLGAAAKARGDDAAAIAAYGGIGPDSPHYAAALAALAQCWRERLAKLAAASQPTAEPAAAAIRTFAAAHGADHSLPEKWNAAHRTAALAESELILAYVPAQAAEAERVLRAALAAGADGPQEWQTAVQAQLVVALASQAGHERQAAEMLQQISAASPVQLLAVVHGLTRVAARSDAAQRPAIASAQIAAIDLLAPHRPQLAAPEQLALDVSRAEALAAAGRREEALPAYAALAKAHPASGAIQEGYAAVLLDTTDRGQLQQALDQWRLVAGKCPPRSSRWQAAKYSVALAQFKLGDKSGAATLLRFVLETPPGLPDGEWEPRYRKLLRQCEQ